MRFLIGNKYIAPLVVFAVFQWFAYAAFTGDELSDSERRRSKANFIEKIITYVTDAVGHVPGALFFSLAGIGFAYLAYKRAVRISGR